MLLATTENSSVIFSVVFFPPCYHSASHLLIDVVDSVTLTLVTCHAAVFEPQLTHSFITGKLEGGARGQICSVKLASLLRTHFNHF